MDAKQLLKRNGELKSQRAIIENDWQNIASYMPTRTVTRLDGGIHNKPTLQKNIFDNTLISSVMQLAAGQVNFLTPFNERWFTQVSPTNVPAVKRYLSRVTEVTAKQLAVSNFYEIQHEVCINRSAFGTALMFVDLDSSGELFFKQFEVGTYCIAENHLGRVDTVFREFTLTTRQAVQQFGLENLSDKLKDDIRRNKNKCMDEERVFVHCVFPADEDRDDTVEPFASYYIDCKDKHIVSKGHFSTMPYVATRYLKAGSSVYGFAPSMEVLSEIRQVNEIEESLDMLAQLQCFPRLIAPNTLEGRINLEPAGVTMYDPINGEPPREWATAGNYEVGLNRLEMKREVIRDAFHSNLFQMISRRDKVMTATEVEELANEKLLQFSPTFSRMIDEYLQPLITRVFQLLYSNGIYDKEIAERPPAELFSDDNKVKVPEVQFSSKIALAIKAMQSNSTDRYLFAISQLAQVDPSVFDRIDLDNVAKLSAEAKGVPTSVLRSDDEVEELRQSRAEQQQMQQQVEMAKTASEAAKNINESGDVKAAFGI